MRFPTYEEMGKEIAEKALDEYIYEGKTLREWVEIISADEKQTNTAELPPKYHKDDLIQRETARRIIDSNRSKEQMLGMLASIPKVENTAEWKAYYKEKDHRYSDLIWYCSNCGERFVIDGKDEMESFKYCPSCGSRMKGDTE